MKEKEIPHRKYDEIENFDREKTLAYYREKDYVRGEWVCEEKFHGSNFVVAGWIDEGEIQVKCGKRTAWLSENEDFFGWHLIKENIEKKIKQLIHVLYDDEREFDIVYVYCELIGGNYPNLNMRKKDRMQKSIFYTPTKIVVGYDIYLKNFPKRENEEEKSYYLDSELKNELFTKAGIIHVKPIFKGKFEECLQHDPVFQTRIPKIFGLEEIEGNIAEGFVMKPVHPIKDENGDMIALKKKPKEFHEKARAKNKPRKQEIKLSEMGEKMLEEGRNYVTENRLNNVMSKIGDVTRENLGKIIGAFRKDIIKDFEKDAEEELNEIPEKEKMVLYKALGREACDLARKILLPRT